MPPKRPLLEKAHVGVHVRFRESQRRSFREWDKKEESKKESQKKERTGRTDASARLNINTIGQVVEPLHASRYQRLPQTKSRLHHYAYATESHP
jgi:hypothetical protein